MRVLVFGDSIANGFYDPQGGWVDRLRRDYLSRNLPLQQSPDPDFDSINVMNLGISADWVRDIVRRAPGEIDARKDDRNELALVAAIGTNDAFIENGVPRSDPERFTKEVEELVTLFRQHTARVLLIGPPPVWDELTTPWLWTTNDASATTERIGMFNQAAHEVAIATKTPFVDLFTSFAGHDHRSLFDDGLHPNAAGHAIIAAAVTPALDALIAS